MNDEQRQTFNVMLGDGINMREARAATAERTRADRLRAAGEALERCGLSEEATMLRKFPTRTEHCRNVLAALISRLSDGSDEPRYAAAMTARAALGRLWEVL